MSFILVYNKGMKKFELKGLMDLNVYELNSGMRIGKFIIKEELK